MSLCGIYYGYRLEQENALYPFTCIRYYTYETFGN